MPIPLLPLHLHVGVPLPSHDGAITLDRQVLLQIEELISRHVPGMSVAFSVASIVVVCGGYTNNLYKLNLLSPSASSALPITSLLLRVYGAGTEKLIDRSVELSLLDHLAVHAPEIAPIMYVAFANGRLEQFIEGARALEAADMRLPSTSLLIAQKMARLHSLPLPSSAVPQPAVWDLIRNWLNGERDMLLVEQGVTAAAVLQQRMQTVEEAMALAQQLQPLLHTDATVLCHNDLLCGNILQEIGGDRLYFIDYECAPRAADVGLVSSLNLCRYGAANAAAFDIANHFVEWQAFEDQAANKFIHYPSQQQKQHFVSAYTAATGGGLLQQQELLAKIDLYIVVAHLLWASWGLYQARTSTIDFDYRSLAANRLRCANRNVFRLWAFDLMGRFAQAHSLKEGALQQLFSWQQQQQQPSE